MQFVQNMHCINIPCYSSKSFHPNHTKVYISGKHTFWGLQICKVWMDTRGGSNFVQGETKKIVHKIISYLRLHFVSPLGLMRKLTLYLESREKKPLKKCIICYIFDNGIVLYRVGKNIIYIIFRVYVKFTLWYTLAYNYINCANLSNTILKWYKGMSHNYKIKIKFRFFFFMYKVFQKSKCWHIPGFSKTDLALRLNNGHNSAVSFINPFVSYNISLISR